MTRLTTATLALLVLAATACGDPSNGGAPPTTGPAAVRVTGYVHAGPVCPVAQNPPDPDCDDRPVAGAELVVVGDGDRVVAETRTGDDGRFELLLPPGSYTLIPQPVEGLLGTAPTQGFTVDEDGAPDLDVAYDTGIR